MVGQLERLLHKDEVMPSVHKKVSAAVLMSLASLAVIHPESQVLKR